MNEILKKNKKIILIVTLIIIIAVMIFVFFFKPKNDEIQSKIFEIRIDESSLWKTNVEYSPDYTTTVHIEKDSFVRILSNLDSVYYYSTNDSVATVGIDGVITVNGVGECTLYGATEEETDGLSNYIKVVVK